MLDKYNLHSEYLGDDSNGKPKFDNTYSEAGQALYDLKYCQHWPSAKLLAAALHSETCPRFKRRIDSVIPMAPSEKRARQPVNVVAKHLGQLIDAPIIDDLLLKKPGCPKMKDVNGHEEKLRVLRKYMYLDEDALDEEQDYNVLLLDDMFGSGASIEVAAELLEQHPNIAHIYFATMAYKRT